MGKPLIIAHRGERILAPENTIEGCKSALEQGADALEVDIRLCGSGEIILFHDKTLMRHFDRLKLSSFTGLDEFKTFSFNSNRYSINGRVVTLKEFLEEFRGKVPINLDAKTLFASSKGFARTLVKDIADMGVLDQVWISAFNPNFLRLLKKMNRRLRVGYLFRNFAFAHRFFDVFIAADAWHPHYHLITAQFVEMAKQKGKELYVWTVNKRQLLNSLSAFPLDGIITDTLFHSQK